MGDALHTHGGVTSAQEARLADAGLIAAQGPSLLDVRTGVMFGPGSTALVTGTNSTAPMRYSVAPHQWVTSRGSAQGVYRGALEATQLVATTAAPASGSRIDLIYEKQADSQQGIPSPDATTAPLYGVVQGQSTTGTPAKPALPVGAIEVATAVVSAGATRTDAAGVTISNTARQTVARGAPIPVRNQAERDALTAYDGLAVVRLDTGLLEVYFGGWRSTSYRPWVETTATGGDGGTSGDAYGYVVPTSASFFILPGQSVNVTVPAGRVLDVEWKAPTFQVGASANADVQLVIGGTVVDGAQHSTGPTTGVFAPVALSGSAIGTGAAVNVQVRARCTAGTARVAGAGIAPVKLRYRIW